MKTPVTVLQEMLVKLGDSPEYECIAQSGPAHSAVFEFRCTARGLVVAGAARSKREAKQEAARVMLAALAAAGVHVPSSYADTPPAAPTTADPSPPLPPPRTHVALLKELCTEFKLGAPEYELVGDTGPAHLRHFTMRACVGQHERVATATTKKQARQIAAEELYTYLREHLAKVTKDFVEEEALVRAHEKVMERYQELKEEGAWRPDLGQRVADYHLGLATHTDAEKQKEARLLLQGGASEAVLCAAAETLGLQLEWSELPREEPMTPLHVVTLGPAAPTLTLAGRDRAAAVAAALHTLRLALRPRPAIPC